MKTPQIKNLIGRIAARAVRTLEQFRILLSKTTTWNYHSFYVVDQKSVRVFHQGLQTAKNGWKHDAEGRVLLLFRGVWKP